MHRLKKQIQDALVELNFSKLTEVQERSLAPGLERKDLIVQSYTGTGKTLAFLLPVMNNLEHSLEPQALVLTPTRELAVQVANDAKKLNKHLGARIALVYGGANIETQIKQLRHGAQLVVGTPGRALDLISRGELKLGRVKTFVLDEADVMLDMGFQFDVEKIMSYMPKPRQTMLFCVDFPQEISSMAHKHMNRPLHINLVNDEKTVSSVTQWVYPVSRVKKLPFLIHLLREIKPTRSIIFCKTKFSTKKLARQLQDAGFNAMELHGNLTQNRRDAIMSDFKAGDLDLLIATDVAARGIHVNQISHVFNFELPADVKYYLHRIGRTGRMHAVGDAISLVSYGEESTLRQIERLIGKQIDRKEVPARYKTDEQDTSKPRKPHGVYEYNQSRRRLFG